MKFSIIMPTYNDSDTITYSFDSVLNQKYENFELIVIDDGSTDNTANVVSEYKKQHDKFDKIKYIYQDNGDQLNAIKNAINYITGDYIYILHSDDVFYNEFVLTNAAKFFEENKNIDAIISDLTLINENNEIIGTQMVRKYENKLTDIPLQLLMLGRNLYVDFCFSKKDVFCTKIYNNYLNWNGPFWLDCESNQILNVKNVNFHFIKYRVFAGNYINNEIGLLNVFNGELRVVIRLMKNFYIPFYKFQYYIKKMLDIIKIKYIPIYIKKETKNKLNVLKFIYNKRISINKYPFYRDLYNFFKNYHSRTIELKSVPESIYYGSDMRKFNKKLISNDLDNEYYHLFDEMSKGFNKIVIKKKDVEKMRIVLKFLCIYDYVEVIEK